MDGNFWTATVIIAVILLFQVGKTIVRQHDQTTLAASGPPGAMHGHTRPLGVTCIAGLYFTSGAWCLLVPVLHKFAPNLLRVILQTTLGAAPAMRPAGFVAGLLAVARLPLIIFGALAAMSLIAGPSLVVTAGMLAALGLGMWRPKRWARMVTIAIAGWVLAVALLRPPQFNLAPQTFTWAGWVGTAAGALFYLFTPAVREAFRPTR